MPSTMDNVGVSGDAAVAPEHRYRGRGGCLWESPYDAAELLPAARRRILNQIFA